MCIHLHEFSVFAVLYISHPLSLFTGCPDVRAFCSGFLHSPQCDQRILVIALHKDIMRIIAHLSVVCVCWVLIPLSVNPLDLIQFFHNIPRLSLKRLILLFDDMQ